MMIRQNFLHQFTSSALPVLEQVIFEGYEQVIDLVPSFLNMRKMDRDIVQSSTISGLPLAPQNAEGQALEYDDLQQGYSKTYTALKYRQGAKITKEMIEDGKYIQMAEVARELGKSMQETRQIVAAGILNNAFTGGATAGPDGVALASASHPLIGGLLGDNTDTADLAVASLRAGIEAMRDTRNLQGLRRPFRAKKLIVTITDQWLAGELLQSFLKPGVSTNDINTLPNLEVVVNDYLSDADSWFLLADQHDLNFYQRTAAELVDDVDFDGDAFKIQCRERFAVGFNDWRGFYGGLGS